MAKTVQTLSKVPSHDELWSYDRQLQALARIAAWIGRRNDDETSITFPGLLAAFLVGSDPVSHWFQQFVGSAASDLFPGLSSTQGIADERERKELLQLVESSELPAPGKKYPNLYSPSTEELLKRAGEYRRLVRSTETVLRPRDVMAAYVIDGPTLHRDDFGGAVDRWRARFVLPDANELSRQVTPGVRRILLRADAIRRANEKSSKVNSASLWLAALEAGSQPPESPVASRACRLLRATIEPASGGLATDFGGEVPPETGGSLEALSGNCARLLHQAQEYSRVYFRSPDQLDDNGLVAALLSGVSKTIDQVLPKSLDREEARRQFLTAWRGEDPALAYVWQRLFDAQGSPSEDGIVSNYMADNPFDRRVRDQLDMESEARAFARIAAARQTKPPLAIGVFGEWGSGKTFFMGRLERYVDELARQAEQGTHRQLFHSDIVQIRFNAWHYMETNLWASLVDFIFRELNRWLCSKTDDLEKVDELFGQLDTARRLQLESVQQIIDAKREERRLEQELEEARHQLQQASQARQTTLSRVARAAVESLWPENEKTLQQAAQQAGLGKLVTQAGDVAKNWQQLRQMAEEPGRFRQSALTVLGNPWMLVTLIVVLVLLPGAGFLVATRYGDPWTSWVQSLLGSLSYYLIAISGVLSYLISVAARSRSRLQSFFDSLQVKIEEQTQAQQTKLTAQAAKLQESREQLEQTQARFQASSRRLDEAQKDWQGSTARGRLKNFIRAKVVDGDYAKHLGIIAAIRTDFGQLVRLMTDDQKQQPEDSDERRSFHAYEMEVKRIKQEVDEAFAERRPTEQASAPSPANSAASPAGETVSSEQAGSNAEELAPDDVEMKRKILELLEKSLLQDRDSELTSFKRIILYIDDLDRCPPQKVVEVLQAIHLLLCFPLFVVVVAVDARWVSRALNREFPDLLEEGVLVVNHGEQQSAADNGKPDPTTETRAHGASSTDYLEKIFQIPYWVRPMNGTAASNYVQWLVQEGRKQAAPSRHDMAEAGIARDAANRPGSAEADVGSAGGANVHESPQETRASETSGQQDDSQQKEAEQMEAEQVRAKDAAQVIKSLELSDHEERILGKLAPFVGGSPRRGLRFVNSYRLVKTSLKPHQLDPLVGERGEQPNYRALITQLAITTGAPHVAQHYFETIANTADNRLPTLLENLGQQERITRFATEWQTLQGALQTLNKINSADPVDDEQLMQALKDYAPVARRYSFTARPH